MKKGILLINLGTPDSAHAAAVRRYLRDFLLDYRVVSLNPLLRNLLVYGLILPFRSPKTAKAYQSIWTDEGSPLLVHSLQCAQKLKEKLPNHYNVELGMRYGSPSISSALDKLGEVSELIILPLFPQYASATTGSVIEHIFTELKSWEVIPTTKVIRDFYCHPAFIKAQAQQIKSHISPGDFLLLSYHGLPEAQLSRIGCQCSANTTPTCTMCPPINACYRKQCIETTKLIQQEIAMDDNNISMSFQSRLGRTPWIKPYTDEMLIKLRNQGVNDLAIACPSFVADCLETLEEIGIAAHESWQKLGGGRFTLIPCLNSDDLWVEALIEILGPAD